MADKRAKPKQQVVDTIYALLPKDPVEASGVSIAICAATSIDAGMTDEAAVRGLETALKSLRRRGAGEGRH